MLKMAITSVTALALLGATIATSLDEGQNSAQTTSTPSRGAVPPDINEKYLSPDLDVDQWVGRFEGESREIYRSREAIVAALGLEPGVAIGDIGAGTGLFTRLFASRAGDQGRVYAVDISPRFAEHLREIKEREGLANVQVVVNSATSTGLEPASIDLAFLCDVYHHFESPDVMLQRLKEALRPGGRLVVIDFERIPGQSQDWVVKHVRAGKEVFKSEIIAAGFEFDGEISVAGLADNYVLGFQLP
jgi:predicted methyltransferase